MNGWDIFLLVLLALAVGWAILHIVRVKKRGGGVCGGDCSRCSMACGHKGKPE